MPWITFDVMWGVLSVRLTAEKLGKCFAEEPLDRIEFAVRDGAICFDALECEHAPVGQTVLFPVSLMAHALWHAVVVGPMYRRIEGATPIMLVTVMPMI